MSGLSYKYILSKVKPDPKRNYQADADDVMYYDDFANSKYTTSKIKGVLAADWNLFDGQNRVTELLERAGYEVIWEDEYVGCSNCYRAICTSPDSYCYKPEYAWLSDCEPVCLECLLANKDWLIEHLRSLENDPTKALNLAGIDPEDYGYEQLTNKGRGPHYSIYDPYENGWYGTNDNPKEIYTKYRDEGLTTPILFAITSNSQFAMEFKAYTRPQEDTDDKEPNL